MSIQAGTNANGKLSISLDSDVAMAMVVNSGLKSRKRRHVKKRIKRLLNNLLLAMIEEYEQD